MQLNRKYFVVGFLIVSFGLMLFIYYSGSNSSIIVASISSINRWTAGNDTAKQSDPGATISWAHPVATISWTHPVCNCTRDIPLYSPQGTDNQLESTCGPVADIRGPHQRVISFVFYGDVKSDYFKGILRNAKLMPIRYPGWAMRLYHNIPPTDAKQKSLCERICAHPILDDCYVGDLSSRLGHNLLDKFGMLWRFLPLGDPLVDIVNVRDIDSTIYQREVDAVNEWLKSDKTWHVLRDHPWHHKEMMGGGWGVKNSVDLPKMAGILDAMLKHKGEKKYGYDEMLLTKIVFPEAKKSLLAHDSFLCKEHPDTVPFPTQRVNRTFVIDKVGRDPNLYIKKKCPIECRPAAHKDWLYC